MQAEAIIVECGACGQPFEVALSTFTSVAEDELTVPAHVRRDPGWASPMCDGGEVPAIARGTRSTWERWWTAKHPGEPLPTVLDGSGVKPRRIR